jgi:hypothetical protein
LYCLDDILQSVVLFLVELNNFGDFDVAKLFLILRHSARGYFGCFAKPAVRFVDRFQLHRNFEVMPERSLCVVLLRLIR